MSTETVDITRLVLTKEEQAIFDRFKHGTPQLLTVEEFRTLERRRLLEGSLWFAESSEPVSARLNDTGRQLLAYQLGQAQRDMQLEARFKTQLRVAKRANWIAMLSLLLSAVSLFVSLFFSAAPQQARQTEPQPETVLQTIDLVEVSDRPSIPEGSPKDQP